MGGAGAEALNVVALRRRDGLSIATCYNMTAAPKIGSTHRLGHVGTRAGDEKYSNLLDLRILGIIV